MATENEMERFPLIAEDAREKTSDMTSKEQHLKKSLGCFSMVAESCHFNVNSIFTKNQNKIQFKNNLYKI